MADELIPAPAPAAPAPVPAVEPAPAPAVPVDAAPGQAPTPAPVKPGAQPESAPVKPGTEPSSLLSEAKPAEAAPSKDASATPPAEGEKPKEGEAAQPAPEAPITYEPWKLPEGMTFSEADAKPFTDILAGLKAPQEVGQQLIDLHLSEVAKLQERIAAQQTESWNATRKSWVDQVKADPAIGGNRLETVLHSAGAIIEQYGGTPDQVREVRTALALTGAGDHPALVRLFNNLGNALAREGRPIAATTPVPAQLTRAQRRYSRSTLNGGATT